MQKSHNAEDNMKMCCGRGRCINFTKAGILSIVNDINAPPPTTTINYIGNHWSVVSGATTLTISGVDVAKGQLAVLSLAYKDDTSNLQSVTINGAGMNFINNPGSVPQPRVVPYWYVASTDLSGVDIVATWEHNADAAAVVAVFDVTVS